MCIWMQKSIEFQLPPYEIPQLWSYYSTLKLLSGPFAHKCNNWCSLTDKNNGVDTKT